MVVRISKLMRAPVAEVFSWCTDYSDLDPQITGSGPSQTREVVARNGRTVILVDKYADPAIKERRVEVSLRPPNQWHAKFIGGRWEGTGKYVLSEIPEGTRLDIVFRIEKTIKGYTSEDLRQRANEIWDKYVTEMEKDLQSRRVSLGVAIR